MPHWFDILTITILGIVILLYVGWGLVLWLVPQSLSRRYYLLIPFVGLFFIDSFSHLTLIANIPGNRAIFILFAVVTIANLSSLIWKRQNWRLPNRQEVLIILFASPALLFALMPLFSQDELLALGWSNADTISHSIATDWLQENSFRDPLQLDPEHPGRNPINFKIKIRNVRLGFHFYQMYLDILSNRQGYETFSIVVAIGFYLWSIATGFLAGEVIQRGRLTALLATLFFALSGLPLWIAFGGYGPQILGMGLMVMAFACWALALQAFTWRMSLLAAAFSAAFAGIYSDALPYLVVPIGLMILLLLLNSAKDRDFTRLREILKASVLGAILVFVLSPVGIYRAIFRSLRVATNEFGGNVGHWIPFRQITGLAPFGQQLSRLTTEAEMQILGLLTIIVGALIVFGFFQLRSRSKLIAISFVIPHLATVIWFRINDQTYYYFKSWSMGWFIYLILLVVGLVTLIQLEQRRKVLRGLGLAALLLLFFLFARTSIRLSSSIVGTNALTPSIVELKEWVSEIDPQERIFVSTGDLSPVSVDWIAYFLIDHPIHVDETVANTHWDPYIYQSQPWVIDYRDDSVNWNTDIFHKNTLRQNEDFDLLKLDLKGGRQFEIPDVEHEIGARLGEQFELLGFNLSSALLSPGSEVQVTLYWLMRQKTDQNYKVFLHLLDQNGNLVHQLDAYPVNWLYNTFHWLPDEVVVDKYEVPLESNLSPGIYTLRAGMYLEESGERLPVTIRGQEMQDNSIVLTSQLEILSP